MQGKSAQESGMRVWGERFMSPPWWLFFFFFASHRKEGPLMVIIFSLNNICFDIFVFQNPDVELSLRISKQQ